MSFVVSLIGLLLQIPPILAQYNDGQYTVIPTVVSYSQSWYVSYGATEVVTIYTTVPCPTYTTYTTVTVRDCCGAASPTPTTTAWNDWSSTTTAWQDWSSTSTTICPSKTCYTSVNGALVYEPTAFSSGEIAVAQLWFNGANVGSTSINNNWCPTFAAFVTPSAWIANIPCCGGGAPVQLASTLCAPKTCYVLNNGNYVFSNPAWFASETAPAEVISNGDLLSSTSLLVQGCSQFLGFTTPATLAANAVPCTSSPACDRCGVTCPISVVTYSYSTAGRIAVAATTLQQPCDPFSLANSNSEGSSVKGANVLLFVWTTAALLSGLGMVVL